MTLCSDHNLLLRGESCTKVVVILDQERLLIAILNTHPYERSNLANLTVLGPSGDQFSVGYILRSLEDELLVHIFPNVQCNLQGPVFGVFCNL